MPPSSYRARAAVPSGLPSPFAGTGVAPATPPTAASLYAGLPTGSPYTASPVRPGTPQSALDTAQLYALPTGACSFDRHGVSLDRG